jgi:hypothetical protein
MSYKKGSKMSKITWIDEDRLMVSYNLVADTGETKEVLRSLKEDNEDEGALWEDFAISVYGREYEGLGANQVKLKDYRIGVRE